MNELAPWAARNSMALAFVSIGAVDYRAARCCLLNDEFGGLQLGAQGLEKTLKGLVLLTDRTADLRKGPGRGHSLSHLFDRCSSAFRDFSVERLAKTMARFEAHYAERYPDLTLVDDPREANWHLEGELHRLDEAMIDLSVKLPIPPPFRYRVGVLGGLAMQYAGQGRRLKWLVERNDSLGGPSAELRSALKGDVLKRLGGRQDFREAMHPSLLKDLKSEEFAVAEDWSGPLSPDW